MAKLLVLILLCAINIGFAFVAAINFDNYLHHNGGATDLAVGILFAAAVIKLGVSNV